MYLAYFNIFTPVSLTNSGSSETVFAPVRVGEITRVTIDTSSTSGSTGRLQLGVEAGGRVTSNPPIVDCIGFIICAAQVAAGTVVTLTATPFADNRFEELGGCDQMIETPDGGTCVITIKANGYPLRQGRV
jgi:hypothetical protein